MALNYIWIAFFLIAFVIALIRLIFFGDTEIFRQLVDGMFDSSKSSVMDIALPLIGNMALWLGILNIGEKAGAIRFLSRIVGPFFHRLFPEVPKDHPATGQMMMNFSANMLGLDNAATPFGLKAMGSLQELNKEKETASNAQIMFLVLHTSGLTILPISIIAQRAILHAHDPADVFIPCIIATFVATLAGIIAVAIKQKINLFDKVIISWLGGITAFLLLMIWYFDKCLTKQQIEEVSKVASNLIIFVIPVLFLVVGISVFRTCGALDYIVDGFKWACIHLNIDSRFCDGLPVALLKPLSGSGARSMMISNMIHFKVDSFVGRLSCVFNGSADTTFYIVALYFGSVGIKNSRYAVPFGLIADFAGIIAAILVSYLFFG